MRRLRSGNGMPGTGVRIGVFVGLAILGDLAAARAQTVPSTPAAATDTAAGTDTASPAAGTTPPTPEVTQPKPPANRSFQRVTTTHRTAASPSQRGPSTARTAAVP